MNEVLQIGQWGLPAILTVLLALFYKTFESMPNKIKPWIAVALSIILSLVALQYAGKSWDFKTVTEYVLYGIMMGAAAVGIYEVSRTIYRPRE